MDTDLLLNNGIESLPQFITSLAIGLLIGLERERTAAPKAGLRTFALVAMFGTLAALLSAKFGTPWLFIAGLLAVAAMIIAAYRNDHSIDADPGTTTVIALLMSYGLGAMVWYGLVKLAVMLAIGVTALLYFKPELRGLSRRMTRRDLVAVLQFSVLTFIVLPILPDQNYGPYDAVNPHQAWLMVVLISGISLSGYVALKVVGTRYGAPLLGILGGLVSSTATTLIYAKNSKISASATNLAAAVIIIASTVVLLRLMILSSLLSDTAPSHLLLALGCGLITGLAAALYNWRKMKTASELYVPETSNPAELHTAISFGLLYVIVLLCSSWMMDVAGSQGLYIVALISGLTDVDAITLSSLRLSNLGQLTEHQTTLTIILAFLANLAFKFGIVVFIAGWPLARMVAVSFLMIAVGLVFGILVL